MESISLKSKKSGSRSTTFVAGHSVHFNVTGSFGSWHLHFADGGFPQMEQRTVASMRALMLTA